MLSPFSCVRFFATLWTVAHQAPLSMGILHTKILEWVAIPSSRDLPNPVIKPMSLTLAGRFFTTRVTWEAQVSGAQVKSVSVQNLVGSGNWDTEGLEGAKWKSVIANGINGLGHSEQQKSSDLVIGIYYQRKSINRVT